MKSRVDEAVKMFESGFNCCQSVFATYADVFGLDRETALKLASPMGGGVGKMREICGAVSAMALLEGLKEGNSDENNQEAKTEVYENVQGMSEKFKFMNGSIICRQLLSDLEANKNPAPSERNAQYYGTRPCSKFVADASKIIESVLLEDMID